jgi:transposase
MMGYQPPAQGKLFYLGCDLNRRVRANHPLRKITELIDFEFIYNEVKETYGSNGNVSTPPPVILKLMLLLTIYNVRSERELMETAPERLDWLWFLGYDLDSEIPDHSVLSKARKRWGAEAFRHFFERIVWQCVEAGLVDGSKLFVDSSLIEADASNNSVVDRQSLKYQLNKHYDTLEARLAEQEEEYGKHNEVNQRYVSTTDPDAAIVRRGSAKLRYQTHRAVEGTAEVITAVTVTAGDVNEAHLLTALLDSHAENTGSTVETVVGDKKYGTIENYLACHDRGIDAHMPDLHGIVAKRSAKENIFPEDRFTYDSEQDHFLCPAGQILRPMAFHRERQKIEYRIAKRICGACALKAGCTKSKTGRSVQRHVRQEELQRMRDRAKSAQSKRDIRTRQHLMERSFARSTRYGFDRARWRGLWRMHIQEYLICAVQNIETLLRYARGPKRAAALVSVKGTLSPAVQHGMLFTALQRFFRTLCWSVQ